MAKVMVINLEGGPVKVEVQQHGPDGRFKAVAEYPLKKHKQRMIVVEEGQSLQVIAMPAKAKS